ncbi:methyltransferase family protein [Hoeflea marina]|uniref:Methyltransferase family protein n=1 Tax=Hoeflea marina TaxID=274592 RepID=A0A317PQ11_9HYPH|nr:class I SAM-dependent methyltransferase [Hoeflea marina]PWW02249.1 methyltransferase family protein [Hoeflea marina]
MNDTSTITAAPDYAVIKAKQNSAWASGDYALIGTTLQIVGENLAEAMDLPAGAKVLDVAAGNGNATLAFARRGSRVTSTDYVEALLEKGRARAQAEGLDIACQVADAEKLPFENDSFDAVVSTYGVMFTPNQLAAAREMLRVCRSGGKIGLANWTPEGFIGTVFKTLGKHMPPPAGVQSPALWGSEEWIRSSFGSKARKIDVSPRDFVFRYRSAAEFMHIFRTYYGPIHKAFLALPEDVGKALHVDLMATIARYDTATDGTLRVPSAYLEIVITKC